MDGLKCARPATRNDMEHDAFWTDMLGDLLGFLPDVDVFPARGPIRPLPITVIARYKTVVWNTRGAPIFQTDAVMNGMTMFGSDQINVLSLFMRAGGKVLICGNNAMSNTINRNLFPGRRIIGKGPAYPFIFRYESAGSQGPSSLDPVGEETFAYDDFCLNVLDVPYGVGARRTFIGCRVSDFRRFDGKNEGLRAAVPADSTSSFPRLELRPEVAGPGKFFNEGQLGLNTDVYNPVYFESVCGAQAELSPRRSCFRPIYKLECLDESSGIFGATVAYWTTRFANIANPDGLAARSAVWGFEPVYFNPAQVQQALDVILFDEWQLPKRH